MYQQYDLQWDHLTIQQYKYNLEFNDFAFSVLRISFKNKQKTLQGQIFNVLHQQFVLIGSGRRLVLILDILQNPSNKCNYSCSACIN